jgi:hypothetical protein
MATTSLEIKKHFRKLRDPRRQHGRLHRLLDLVVIAIAAVTGGADTWREMAAFGRRHESWFKRFLALEHGIASHDTFERVFARLDPAVFQCCLRGWLVALSEVLQCAQIAIDGKTLRNVRAPLRSRSRLSDLIADILRSFARAGRGTFAADEVDRTLYRCVNCGSAATADSRSACR